MRSPGALSGYVPALLARRAVDGRDLADGVRGEACELAVVGVDISESSAMTEELSRRGPDGPESLARTLDDVFAVLGDTVVEHGGSVVSLAGDELVGVWPVVEEGREAAVLAAARAALGVRERMDALGPAAGYPLRMRTGLGAGSAHLLDVGRGDGRRLFLVAGPAVQEMARAQHAVEPSETGVGPRAAAILGEAAQLAGDEVPRLLTVDGARGAEASGATGTDALAPAAEVRPNGSARTARAATALSDAAAARYLPAPVLERLRQGGPGLRPELAAVTVLFCSLRTGPWREGTPRHLGQAALRVLDTVAGHGGTLLSGRQDLDGVTIVVAFGLPPVVREHEAARAALCALDIGNSLRGTTEHGIGIATGRALCGVLGSAAYRQYTVVGPVVNLAARLMQEAQNEALCDDVTRHLGEGRLRFSSRGAATVKGFRTPVATFRPEWPEVDPGLPALERLGVGSRRPATRGRERERQELRGRLVALGLGASATVVVEGDPGAGKTHLAMDLLEAAADDGQVLALAGSGDEMDRRPYHAWKPVLDRALGLGGLRDPVERAAAVRARLADHPDLRDWVALVSDVLDLALEDTPVRDMTGRARRENTTRLLLQLLADAAGGGPVLLVLDDCHWLDSASWDLLHALRRGLAPLMVALFTRPLAAAHAETDDDGRDPSPQTAGAEEDALARPGAEAERALRSAGVLWLRLDRLAPDVTEQIARDFLGVDVLDAALRPLFREQVGGSPLFAVELAFQLRTDDVITIEDAPEGTWGRLAEPQVDLERYRLPVRIEEVFRARLSGLSERQRAILRAASVVGSRFDERRVLAADPDLGHDALASDLRALEQAKVVEPDAEGWRFQHALVREVVTRSALPSELRAAHGALAGWYEAHDPRPEDYAILARHWELAGDPERQVEYLEAAAASALLRGLEDEAVALTDAALASDRAAGGLPTVDDPRRAFWHHQRGEALAAQSRLDEAVTTLGDGLRRLGHAVPRGTLAWAWRLVREVLRQLVHLLRRDGRRAADTDRAVAAQAAGTYAALAEAQYFRSDWLAWTAANLAAVNLAERAGEFGLAGRAYSGLANLAGTLRLHPLARRYFRRARQEVHGQYYGTTSARTLAVLPDLAWEHDLTAALSEAVYLRTMNRTTDVLPVLDDVIRRLREAGLNQPLEIALAIRGFTHSAAGTLRAARADFEDLVLSARRRSNVDHLTWGLTLLVPVLLRLDRGAEAQRLDAEAARVYRAMDRLSLPNFHGSHAQALLAAGDVDEALAHAERGLRALDAVPVFFHLAGLTALVEVSLALLRQRRGTPTAAGVERLARRSLRALRRYVRLYPFARARYERCVGVDLALRDRPARAERHWWRGVRLAEESGLLLDAAQLRILLAARLPEGSPGRADLEREARAIAHDLGLDAAATAP